MLLTTFQSGRIGYCKKKRQGSYFISLSYRLYSSIAQETELHIFNQGIWNMTCMSTAFLFEYYSYSYSLLKRLFNKNRIIQFVMTFFKHLYSVESHIFNKMGCTMIEIGNSRSKIGGSKPFISEFN